MKPKHSFCNWHNCAVTRRMTWQEKQARRLVKAGQAEIVRAFDSWWFSKWRWN